MIRCRFRNSSVACLFLMIFYTGALGETVTDSALWSGALFLWERDSGLNFSAEYQVRLDENMSALNSHFLELMTYKKTTASLLMNGGYRFTRRPDHDENRLYLGGFWDITRSVRGVDAAPDKARVVLQVGYQRDFNINVDDVFMPSNSIRWVFVASRQMSEKLRPFLLAGILTTWNDAHGFGVDKLRLGGGVVLPTSNRSRLRAQYIYEKAFFLSPIKQTHIFWLRYEANFGI